MFVRENPVRGEIVQSVRMPVSICIEVADEKGGSLGGKKLHVKRGYYLIVSSSGQMKALSPTEYALRYSAPQQHFDCRGKPRHSTPPTDFRITPEEIDALMGDGADAG